MRCKMTDQHIGTHRNCSCKKQRTIYQDRYKKPIPLNKHFPCWQGRSLNKYINQYPEHEQERTTQNHQNINVTNSIHCKLLCCDVSMLCLSHFTRTRRSLKRTNIIFCECVRIAIFRVFSSKIFSRKWFRLFHMIFIHSSSFCCVPAKICGK